MYRGRLLVESVDHIMSWVDDGLYQCARDRLRMHLPRKNAASQPRMCEPVQPSIIRADANSFFAAVRCQPHI